MNTEIILEILDELNQEMDSTRVVNKLNEMRDNLQNMINQSGNSNFQTGFVNSRDKLYTALSSSKSNNFSPMWRQIVKQMDASNLIGIGLKEELETILAQNQLTPAVALEKINAVITRLKEFTDGVEESINGLTKLKISKSTLKPGECEIGVTIPRSQIKNELKSLIKEMNEFNFILDNFTELVEGKKENFEVASISSSDFTIIVPIYTAIAVVLGKSIEKIIDLYKKVLEIKKLKLDLERSGIPEDSTKGIADYSQNMMENEIAGIVDSILEKYWKGDDKHRKNEIKNGLIISLNKIANRIDNGFNYEIRIAPLKENDEKTKKLDIENVEIIQSFSKTLEFMKVEGKPILKLNETIEKKEKPPKE